MTIWSLILVVLAGVSLAAGWRLRLNEPILISIGLSTAALLLLVASMIRDRSAKRKKATKHPSGGVQEPPVGVSKARPQPAAAGYGVTAFQPILPSSTRHSDGSTGSRPFTEPHPAARSVEPLDPASWDVGEVPGSEGILPESQPAEGSDATVQVLPPAAEEPSDLHGEERTEAVSADAVAAETEAFSMEAAEADVSPAPEQGSPEVARKSPTSAAWGFHYPSDLPLPGEGPAEPDASRVPEEASTPEADQRKAVPASSAKGRPLRRKSPGKLVYWWEAPGQKSSDAATKRETPESPVPQPESLTNNAEPAESPQGPGPSRGREPDDVSATPAARTKPPEITIRLVPAPKRRTKPVAKRPKAKPASGRGAGSTARAAAPTPTVKAQESSEDETAGKAEPSAGPRTTGKPVPEAKARPTIASKPATKLRTTARPKTKPRRADLADGSEAPTTPSPEEGPFKYLR